MIQMVSPKRKPISASLRSPSWGNPRRQAAGFQAKTTSRDLEQCLVEAEELRVASELQQLHAWIPHNSCTSRQNSFSHHLPLNYSHISHAYTNYIIMIQFMTRKERWNGLAKVLPGSHTAIVNLRHRSETFDIQRLICSSCWSVLRWTNKYREMTKGKKHALHSWPLTYLSVAGLLSKSTCNAYK